MMQTWKRRGGLGARCWRGVKVLRLVALFEPLLALKWPTGAHGVFEMNSRRIAGCVHGSSCLLLLQGGLHHNLYLSDQAHLFIKEREKNKLIFYFCRYAAK